MKDTKDSHQTLDSNKTQVPRKTFWPLGIALFLICMICMIILTIIISIKNSPDDDNAYFSTRQVVDKEINDIIIAQNELEKKYDFFITSQKSSQNSPLTSQKLYRKATRKSKPLTIKQDETFQLSVFVAKKGDSLESHILPQRVLLYITRFASAKDDIDLGELAPQKDSQAMLSKPILLNKGQWKVLVKVEIDGKNAYFEQLIEVVPSNKSNV